MRLWCYRAFYSQTLKNISWMHISEELINTVISMMQMKFFSGGKKNYEIFQKNVSALFQCANLFNSEIPQTPNREWKNRTTASVQREKIHYLYGIQAIVSEAVNAALGKSGIFQHL